VRCVQDRCVLIRGIRSRAGYPWTKCFTRTASRFRAMPLPSMIHPLIRNNPDQIAAAIVNPQDSTPVRMPIQTGTERTAVLPFQATGTLTFDATAAGKARALLFRHTLSPLWLSGTFTNAATRYYSEPAEFTQSDTVLWQDLPLVGQVYWDTPGATTFPTWWSGSITNTSPVQNVPIGHDSTLGKDFFWVPGGYAYIYIDNVGTASGTMYADLNMWTAPGAEEIVGINVWSIGTVLFRVVAPGWYRWVNLRVDSVSNAGVVTFPTAVCGFSTAGTLPATGGGQVHGLWPFNPPPDFGSVTSYPWASTRCNAAAVLMTNVSQVVEKQGTVLAARLTGADMPFNPATATLSTRIPNEKYFGAFEHGVYGYSSPSPESQQYRMDYRSSSGGNPLRYSNPLVHLEDNCYYSSFLFMDSSSSPFPMIAVTVDWHLEFRCTSPLFLTAISSTSLEAVHQAHLAVGSLHPFSENPDHKKLRGAVISIAHSLARTALGSAYGPVKTVAKAAFDTMRQNIPGSDVPLEGKNARKGGGGKAQKKGKKENKKPNNGTGKPKSKKKQ